MPAREHSGAEGGLEVVTTDGAVEIEHFAGEKQTGHKLALHCPRIDLREIDADVSAGGNQAFRFIGDAPFTRAGQVHAEATTDGDFLVSGNVDRDLDADFAFVVHTGVAKLVATDFLL